MEARVAWILTPVVLGVAASSSDEQVTAPEFEDQPTALTTAATSSALPTKTVIVFKSTESVHTARGTLAVNQLRHHLLEYATGIGAPGKDRAVLQQ